MWWVAIICAILGASYGLYVVSTWSEAVEFAQSWAGLVTYPKDNPWGQILLGDSSLQISLPTLLLHYGADPWPLSLASTTFCCVLAFTAAGTTGFALTRQLPIAIIGALACSCP